MNSYVNFEVTLCETTPQSIYVFYRAPNNTQWIPKCMLKESNFISDIQVGDKIEITILSKLAKEFGWC